MSELIVEWVNYKCEDCGSLSIGIKLKGNDPAPGKCISCGGKAIENPGEEEIWRK